MELIVKLNRTAECNLPLSGAVEDITHLKVYLMHTTGKGYSLSLLGVKVEPQAGVNIETHRIFDGRHKRFELVAAPRYSQKRLEALAALVQTALNAREGPFWEKACQAAAGWGGELS